MNYQNYIRGISFRLMQPWMPIRLFKRLINGLARLDISFEILNTSLPEARPSDARLRELCKVPRMSTYAVAAMINRGVAEMPAGQAFVNVGVWNGFTLLSAMANNADKRCVGVDNFSEFGGPRDAFLARFNEAKSAQHEFFDMDYEEYFAKTHRGEIGFYLYDGEHSYENQLKGMRVAEPFFAKDCLVLVDDTNLPYPRRALEDFIAQSSNKYEILLDSKSRSNLHPTIWNGVIIMRRVG